MVYHAEEVFVIDPLQSLSDMGLWATVSEKIIYC